MSSNLDERGLFVINALMPPKKKGESSSAGGKQQALLSKFFKAPPTAGAQASSEAKAETAGAQRQPDRPQAPVKQHPPPAPNVAPDVRRAAKAKRVLDPPAEACKPVSSPNAPKRYTPLESRVLEIRSSHPDVILLVEVCVCHPDEVYF